MRMSVKTRVKKLEQQVPTGDKRVVVKNVFGMDIVGPPDGSDPIKKILDQINGQNQGCDPEAEIQ